LYDGTYAICPFDAVCKGFERGHFALSKLLMDSCVIGMLSMRCLIGFPSVLLLFADVEVILTGFICLLEAVRVVLLCCFICYLNGCFDHITQATWTAWNANFVTFLWLSVLC